MTAKAIFVAGSHTDVGKTYVSCALIRAARARDLRVEALKPVISGFDPADWGESDSGHLVTALGLARTPEAMTAISPWRFSAFLAPPMAAGLEGKSLPIEPIVEFCRERIAASDADLLVIEGAGGLMSPLADKATCLDLMRPLRLPTVLVGGSYLGAISHTLTARRVLEGLGMPLAAIVISESAGSDHPDFDGTLDLIAEHVAEPLIPVRRDVVAEWPETLLRTLI